MIPYHKPYKFNTFDTARIFNDIHNTLSSGKLTNGHYVKTLENIIKDLYEVDFVIATSSCTQAMSICLDFLRRRIQVPAFTWKSVKQIIDDHDYNILYVDIDKDTWLPVEDVESKRDSIYLHTFGNVGKSKMQGSNDDVLYDGSHCLGALFEDIGTATCISLAPTKPITSIEGGLILTNNAHLNEYAIEVRDMCCRMSEIHAIFGIQNLRYLSKIIDWKAQLYKTYKRHIPGQFQKIETTSSFNTIGFLNTENLKIPKAIETRQYYIPLEKGHENSDFVYRNIVCLPSYYQAPIDEIIRRIKELNNL